MSRYPGRLLHSIPHWVHPGGLFHIRIRTSPDNRVPLTDPALSKSILAYVRRYHEQRRWWCPLFLLMPDHTHALMSFPPDVLMSEVLRNWKRGVATVDGVSWQDGYFDHRIRHEESLHEKWLYILNNPVALKLCGKPDDWPHVWTAPAQM